VTASRPRFAQVPVEAISDSELTPSEFKVLVALYSFRNAKDGACNPKLSTLAALAGFKDPTQVSKITTRLESKGWLTKNQKLGFHGPKKYRLAIPERLTESGQTLQLGQNTQLGEPEQVEAPNLEESANLEETTITKLDKSTNSQLGQNYQGYKNIPVRTELLTEKDIGAPDDHKAIADRVIQELNKQAGKNFQLIDTNRKWVIARLKQGATEADCRLVISRQTAEWQFDRMSKYLRPKTLFAPDNFQSYLDDNGPKALPAGGKPPPDQPGHGQPLSNQSTRNRSIEQDLTDTSWANI